MAAAPSERPAASSSARRSSVASGAPMKASASAIREACAASGCGSTVTNGSADRDASGRGAASKSSSAPAMTTVPVRMAGMLHLHDSDSEPWRATTAHRKRALTARVCGRPGRARWRRTLQACADSVSADSLGDFVRTAVTFLSSARTPRHLARATGWATLALGVAILAVRGLVAAQQIAPIPLVETSWTVRCPRWTGSRRPPRSASAPSTLGHIPIVALTANASPADRDKCLASGMDAYLPLEAGEDRRARDSARALDDGACGLNARYSPRLDAVFAALAAVMFLTRPVEWYASGGRADAVASGVG